jgi:hypothetical protein
VLEYGTYQNFVNKIIIKKKRKEWPVDQVYGDWYVLCDRHSVLITADWATSELTRSVVTMLVCIEWWYMHMIMMMIIVIIILIN